MSKDKQQGHRSSDDIVVASAPRTACPSDSRSSPGHSALPCFAETAQFGSQAVQVKALVLDSFTVPAP